MAHRNQDTKNAATVNVVKIFQYIFYSTVVKACFHYAMVEAQHCNITTNTVALGYVL